MMPRREFITRAFIASLLMGTCMFVALRAALARNGSTGSARSFVTVAGTLTGVSGPTAVTFEFRRPGATTAECAPVVTITPEAGGAFSAEVPLDMPELTMRCPDALFDGRDVVVRATVGGRTVAEAAVNPVPYAHFATNAGSAAVAQQYATPDCPVGYERDATDPSFVADMRLCKRFRGAGATRTLLDEVVRVGTGASAFWIDRYEAIAVEVLRDGSENTRFGGPDDFGALPRNGQWRTLTQVTSPTFARSVPGVTPARWITWFQAQEACRASGKRLATGEEWLTAAQGTPDPPTAADGMGMNGRCLTAVEGPRATGGRAAVRGAIGCESAWGAQDMIGNVEEWSSEWQAGIADDATSLGAVHHWPGSSYFGDGTNGITSYASSGDPVVPRPQGVPVAIARGGAWDQREEAGIFTLEATGAASRPDGDIGFRCVIPR